MFPLQTLQRFMDQQTIQQAKIIDMMSATVELVRESAAQLQRLAAPCPTCAGQLLENLMDAYNTQQAKENRNAGEPNGPAAEEALF